MMKNKDFDLRTEFLRKGIHLCSLSIPIIYNFITKEQLIYLIVPLTFLSLLFDFGRHFFAPLHKIVDYLFGFMLREHEKKGKKNLSGASYVFLAAIFSILILPKIIAITAFSILIISDTCAAIIGIRFGKQKFLYKSLQGTAAFFFSACVVILFTPKVQYLQMEYFIGFTGAFLGAFAENLSYGWADDNFTIPLSVGGSMWLLYYLLLPTLSL